MKCQNPDCGKEFSQFPTKRVLVTIPPSGFCQCGCGKRTLLRKRSDSTRGWKRGDPAKYITGHSTPGIRTTKKYCSRKCGLHTKDREWRATPEGRRRNNESGARWAKAHPKKRKEVKSKSGQFRLTGFTDEMFRNKIKKQKGLCAICKRPLKVRGMPGYRRGRHADVAAADHCHVTLICRGVIHQRCNRGIGMFKDDPAILRAAANYLEKYQF